MSEVEKTIGEAVFKMMQDLDIIVESVTKLDSVLVKLTDRVNEVESAMQELKDTIIILDEPENFDGVEESE